MKVLYIGCEAKIGGAVNSLFELARYMKTHNVQIVLIIPSWSTICEKLDEYRIEYYIIPYISFIQTRPNNKLKYILKYIIRFAKWKIINRNIIERIEKVVDVSKYDIIHTNNSRIDIGAILAKKYKKKHIWHIREFGEKDFHTFSYIKDYVNYMQKETFLFIAVSNCVRDFWIKKGIEPEKIITIYNGVNVLKKKKNNKTVSIVMAGQILRTKGQDQAIRAIDILKKESPIELHLDIFGDKGDKKFYNELLRYIKEKKLEKFISFKEYDKDIVKKYCNYDIGLMCSKSEAFGRVTAEYMMAGLAIIASDTGANIELIEDKKDGVIYRYGDTEDLAFHLKELVSNSMLREQLSNNAQMKADCYSISEHGSKIFNLYNEILQLD